ncbi:MAG: preprotein translocase subunit SecG [Oscillospiraceae bacterium]|nr:preprotein translocase subunit SecG [Oscillospiraceae bacterium]
MNVFEIISGVILILASLVIILLVMTQDSKGNGLSGAIAGGENMMNEGRMRTKDVVLAKYTKIAAIVFFVVTLVVSAVSIYVK